MSYDSQNIFAKIIRGEIPCKKVYEDDEVLAFYDVNPVAPVHVLVIPKGEFVSFNDFSINAAPEKIADFFQKVQNIAKILDVVDSGYRIITNHGENASQTVPHFHIHIIAGKMLGGLIPGDKYSR